ncbi:hypothetical protein NL676_024918 [Syzygium grande]|nr:hypothetical protein NL676_024918 [Syzygium grande]
MRHAKSYTEETSHQNSSSHSIIKNHPSQMPLIGQLALKHLKDILGADCEKWKLIRHIYLSPNARAEKCHKFLVGSS